MTGLGDHPMVLSWAIDISAFLVLLSLVAAFVRMVLGPTLVDRVVAVDLITVLAVAVAGLVAVAANQPAFLDVAVATALVAFLATVAFAWYANRRADQFRQRDETLGRKGKW